VELYVKLNTAEDLRKFMNIAWECEDDIGVHGSNDQIADAKSILGLISMDYTQPILVVTDSEQFIKNIKKWIVTA
jgi:phosphotransferase system HPr-like phosphotransfer protein